MGYLVISRSLKGYVRSLASQFTTGNFIRFEVTDIIFFLFVSVICVAKSNDALRVLS